jgi:hypothetical protein
MNVCEMCGASLTVAATGRKRRYCSGRCRQAASRERQGFTVDAAALGDAVLPEVTAAPVDEVTLRRFTAEALAAELEGVQPGDPMTRLIAAVGETENLAYTYKTLAQIAPRNLAWRANAMAEHLRRGLDRFFTN